VRGTAYNDHSIGGIPAEETTATVGMEVMVQMLPPMTVAGAEIKERAVVVQDMQLQPQPVMAAKAAATGMPPMPGSRAVVGLKVGSSMGGGEGVP
jgi:hypothetical protein